jgi:hypothetical protein
VGDGLANERVQVGHSAAILGCVLGLSQRVAVIWRENTRSWETG